MLWLHIGMPKTGTSALQGFLRSNHANLARMGLRYLEAGRRRPGGVGNLPVSHNRMVFDLNKSAGSAESLRDEVTAEYMAHRDQNCVVSSEMFYTFDLALLASVFRDIPREEMQFIFYCRRYSDFFEADYKQRAKNGKIRTSASHYVKERLDQIREFPERHNFSGRTAALRAAFPNVVINPCIYERKSLQNENVIDDFLTRLGADLTPDMDTATPANPSLSRVGSEAFGIVTRAMGKQQSRRLRRQSPDTPIMRRSHDVLEFEERAWLDQHLSATDEDFRQEFFAERQSLFTSPDLSDAEKSFRRDTHTEVLDLQNACEVVFRMALKVAKKAAS